MYTTSTMRIVTNSASCCINYIPTKTNILVNSGTSNLYIQSALGLKIFGTYRPFKYVTNIFPWTRTPASNVFNFELYEGSQKQGGISYVLSSHNMSVVMGQRLTTPSKSAMVNFSTKQITTEYETYVYGAVNSQLPMHFESGIYDKNEKFTITNSLCTLSFNVNFETLLYPFSMTASNYLYAYFEVNNNTQITYDYNLNSLQFPQSSHTLLRPMFLFSSDKQNWYKYNPGSATFTLQTPADTYFTPAEFLTKANTYTEYLQIETSAFTAQFPLPRIYVLATSYIYPKAIDTSFWTSQLDVQDFVWAISKPTKWTFVSGII